MTLQTNSITDYQWASDLWNYSGRDGVVNYSIVGEVGHGSVGISQQEAGFIRSIFNQIDELTGLTFQETDHANADITTVSVARYEDPRVMGRAVNSPEHQRMFATWADEAGANLTFEEAETIMHEIGHAVGLGHPHGNGFAPGINEHDTIMSYHDTGAFVGYSATDIAALQTLWGVG